MIYFTFLPDYKNHRNISGNAVMNQQMYLRYFDKKKDILLNATAKKDLLTITKKIICKNINYSIIKVST